MRGINEGLRWSFLLTLGLTCASAAPSNLSPKVSSGEEVLIITTGVPSLSDEADAVTTTIRSQGSAESWELDNDVHDEKARMPEVTASATGPDLSKTMKPEIYSFRIQSDIKYRYSRTYVTSRVANKDLKKSQEVTFRIVLPETAFISKFVMEIDGKAYEAYVKQKDEAKKVYNEAQSQGQSAGLVELSTRNSNIFNVNVNIKPQAKVTFNLTYEELLSRRLGRYEQAINISPEQVSSVKDFQILVNIEESQNITYLRVPDLRNDVEAQEGTDGNNKDAVIERVAGNKATITWKPSVKDQEGLSKQGMSGKFVVQYDINRESNSGEVLVMEGYFVHFFAPENLKPLRKHVVFILDVSGSMWGRKMEQLKVSQKQILDDLSTEDFFNIITFSSDVHLWSPNDPINSDPNSQWQSPPFHGETTPSPVLNSELKKQPFPATKDNIEKAKAFIDSLVANGGTNIHDSIITALNLTLAIKDARDGIVRKIEDSTITYEPLPTALPMEDVTTVVQDLELSTSTISTKTSHIDMISGTTILPKNVESLIIFLTDGEATVGITDPPYIQQLIKAANRNYSIPLFSLGFGEGADFPFLRKLSLQNFGFGRKIYEASDATLQLKGFYNEIASPLLSNVVFNYTSPEYNVTDITITKFPTVFGGTEIAVAGRITPVNPESEEFQTEQPNEQTTVGITDSPIVDGDAPMKSNLDKSGLVVAEKQYLDVSIVGSGREGMIDFDAPTIFCRPIPWDIPSLRPFPPRPTPPPTQEDQFLERLWAYLTIKQLIEKDFAESDSSNEIQDNEVSSNVEPVVSENKVLNSTIANATLVKETPKQQALRLALKYGFVTPLTSLVVVKPNSTDVTDAISSDVKPDFADSVSAPQSMAHYAIAMPGMTKVHFSAVTNRIGGPQSLAFQSKLPLSMNRPSYGQPGLGHYLMPQRLSTSGSPISYQSLSHKPAIRPTSIQQTYHTTPLTSFQAVPQSLVEYDEEPESLQPSFSSSESTTTPPSLTIDDLQWYDKSLKGLRFNNTLYQAALANVGEFDSYNCTIINTGEKGKCVHLKDCVQPAFIKSARVFRHSYFCPIQSRSEIGINYLGTCCPKRSRDMDFEEP